MVQPRLPGQTVRYGEVSRRCPTCNAAIVQRDTEKPSDFMWRIYCGARCSRVGFRKLNGPTPPRPRNPDRY